MKTYKELIDIIIPKIVERCLDLQYSPKPIASETINRTIKVLKKFESLNIICPNVYSDGDACIEINWHWSKGDWTIPIDKQERYCWDLIIDISDEVIDEKGNCMFMNFDCRKGLSKSLLEKELIFFNYTDSIPNHLIERIREFEIWVNTNKVSCFQR